jgi:hypothetical protein
MTITFISTFQALIWLLAALLALTLYVWKVRPYLAARPEFHEFYALADTQRQRVYAWLKIRWDLSIGAVVMALPSLWNGALDLMIALSLLLADMLPAVAGLDLSALLLPGWLETLIRVAGALIPIIRARYVKGGESEGE